MFKWLKNKAAERSGKNAAISTRTLVTIANGANQRLIDSNGKINPEDVKSVSSAQNSLLIDIDFAISNGMTINEVINDYIRPTLNGLNASEGAIKSINHVLSYRGGNL
ncbi:hypothetical protein [Desulfomicrobium escambiense]|uniref:hypothetical protein n=1 Tax=Desulfomicrobium escambiense TaxID=29503 RepID=UPI0012EB9793|nr:hypothetical protein [Desulfomicrobium escambiense]